MSTPLTQRALIAIASAIALLEGYDVASYGVTVPTLLKERPFAIDPQRAGLFGSVAAFGMLLGAALFPSTSFRWIYVLGILPLAIVFPFALKLLPESPLYLRVERPRVDHRLLGLAPLFVKELRVPTLLFFVLRASGLGWALSAVPSEREVFA